MDAEPFDDFYRVGYARLVGAVGLITGSRAEAQDAVDEAVARAWEQTRRNRPIASLPAWIRTVALNVARGGIRHRSVERRAQAGLLRTEDHGASLERYGAAVDARRALAALPRRQREITVLFYFCDLPVDEIAAELEIDPGTVKSTLHKARAALARVLGDDTNEEEHDAVDA